MNRFPSTILPQTNDPKEIQKGMLDLLVKINKVGSPSTGGVGAIKSVAVDYTFEPNDGVTDLFVTTGAATIIVTLARSSSNPGRLVRVWKADDGAGEVRVIGRTTGSLTETISGHASVYAGLRYQHADIYQDGTTNFNVGQYAQPVAGEPSLGTAHPIPDFGANNVLNNYDPPSGPTLIYYDFSGLVPAGAKAVWVSLAAKSTSAGHDFGFYDTTGTKYTQRQLIQLANVHIEMSGWVWLDSSRHGYIYFVSASFSAVYATGSMYLI